MKHATKDHSYGKALLSGVSVIALGAALGAVTLPAGPAWAADKEIGTDTSKGEVSSINATGAVGADDTLINDDATGSDLDIVFSASSSFTILTVGGGSGTGDPKAFNFGEDAQEETNIEVKGSTGTLDLNGGGTIAEGKTLTVTLGIAVKQTLEIDGDVDGGGNLTVTGGTNTGTATDPTDAHVLSMGGAGSDQTVTLGVLTLSGGEGKAVATNTGSGGDLTATIGDDAATDTLSVTKLVVTGGDAGSYDSTNTVAGGRGGTVEATIESTLTVGEGGIEVKGGDGQGGSNDSDGGAATLTVNSAISWTEATSITVTGGAATGGTGAGGSGGNAELKLVGGIDAEGTSLTVKAGDSVTPNSGGTLALAGSTATVIVGATGAAKDATLGAITITAGDGVSEAGGAATGTFTGKLTSTSFELTGGEGSATKGAQAGGAATATVDGAANLGDVTLKAGKSNQAAGGAATLTTADTLTTKSLTLEGSGGSSTHAIAGVDATVSVAAGKAANLGAVTLTGGAADLGGGGDATLTLGADSTLKTTSLKLIGGAGASGTGIAGGDATANVTKMAADTSLGVITLKGGAGESTGDGGDAELTVTAAAVKFSSLTMTDGAGSNGGVARLEIISTTAQTITGEIKGDGVVSAQNTSAGGATFKGTVEAGTIDIGASSAAARAKFEGDVTTSSKKGIELYNAASLNISGTTDQTITGVITAASDGYGTINITNVTDVQNNKKGGTVTFEGAIGTSTKAVSNITLDPGANVIFGGVVNASTITADSVVTQTGKDNAVTSTLTFNFASNKLAGLRIGDGTTIVVGAGVGAGQTVVTLSSSSNDARLAGVSGGNGYAKDGGVINVEVRGAYENGATFTLINGQDEAEAYTGKKIQDHIKFAEHTFLTFEAVEDASTYDIIVTATAKSDADVAKELGVDDTLVKVIREAEELVRTFKDAFVVSDAVLTAAGIEDADIMEEFASALNDKATAKRLAEQVVVQADTLGAAVSVANTPVVQSASIASNRLASLRTGTRYASNMQTGLAGSADVETGLSGADMSQNKSVWVKPFGATDTQDSKGGVAGYDANTYGLAAGMDAGISDAVRIGAAISYAVSDADGKAAGKSKVETSGFGLSLYGDYTTERFFLEGSIGYGQTSNDVTRITTIAGANLSAKGSYDATQYTAAMRAGMPLKMKGDIFVTPSLGLSWSSISPDKYTETGFGRQVVKIKSRDVFTATLAGEISTRIKSGAGYLVPNAKLGVSYDLQNDGAKATANYVGSTNTFEVKGIKPSKTSGVIGLGVTYDTGLWSIGVGYDGSFRSGNTSHGGSIEARVKF